MTRPVRTRLDGLPPLFAFSACSGRISGERELTLPGPVPMLVANS